MDYTTDTANHCKDGLNNPERARSAIAEFAADHARNINAARLIEIGARNACGISPADLVGLVGRFVTIDDHDDALFEAEQAVRDYSAHRRQPSVEEDADVSAELIAIEEHLKRVEGGIDPFDRAQRLPIAPAGAWEAAWADRRRVQALDWLARYAGPSEPFQAQMARLGLVATRGEIEAAFRAAGREFEEPDVEFNDTDILLFERLDAEAAWAERVIDLPEEPEEKRARLGMQPVNVGLKRLRFESGMHTSPTAWLAKGLLPRTGLAMIYGEGNAGKSFAAVHAALSVAWGVSLFSNRTKRGGVLYLAAEGGKSVIPRFAKADEAMQPVIAAANLARPAGSPPLTRAPIEIVTEAPDLSRDGDLAPLIRTIRDVADEFTSHGERLALVIVDTWHRVLGGADENSAADTGYALKPLLAEAERAGFLVLVVHHPGKEVERGARGSSSLSAAADAIIAVTVPGHGGAQAKPSDAIRKCTVTKMRDGAAGGEFRFALDVHTVGHDEDGDPVTTCAVRPIEPVKRDDDGLSANDRQFADAMRAALDEATGDRVSVKEVRLRFYAERRDAKPDANRKAFTRAFEAAISAGRIGTDSGEEFVWLD